MMSNKHHNLDSDPEDDDYVPPQDHGGSSSEDEGETQNAQPTSPPHVDENKLEAKQARDALWASFQASVTATPPSVHLKPPTAKIKVEKRHRFAGEDFVEVVEVDEDSPDAKKWPVWQGSENAGSTTGSTTESLPLLPTDIAETSTSAPYITPTSAKPLLKRPGPRKSKISLTALPSPGLTKARKLSTLEKSAMDWRAHLQTADDAELKTELEANRRGGGYLEKVEFLKRVDERKEDVFEANKSNKRRRF